MPLVQFGSKGLGKSGLYFQELEEKRGVLTRVFDLLAMGGYVTAGLAKGLIPGNNISVAEGVWGGLKAGNPFGKGYAEGRHTYSEVLGEMGWQPTSFVGKVAKGVVGFAGDVFLDPTTYLTGGVSALVKGTGKAAVAKAGGRMHIATAMKLVKNKHIAKKIPINAERIFKEAKKLQVKYDNLIGYNAKVRDLRWTLAGAPFGKKIFGKYADLGFTVAKADTLQKIGDATFAPLYGNLRHAILGGKLGKLFSTNSTLYKLSKTNPAAMYELMEYAEEEYRLVKNLQKARRLIEKKAKELEGLTPDDTRQIIELMEDPSKWSRVEEVIKFTNTKEAKMYRDQLLILRGNVQKKLDGIIDAKRKIEGLLKTTEGNVAAKEKLIKDLKIKYRDELLNFENAHIKEKNQLEQLNKLYEDEIAAISKELAKPVEKSISAAMPEIEAIKLNEVKKSILKYWDEVGVSVKYKEKTDIVKKAQKKLETEISAAKITKPPNFSQSMFNRILREVDRVGYFERNSATGAETFRKHFPYWREEVVQGKYRFYPPQDVHTIEKEIKMAHKEAGLKMRDTQPVIDKVKLIEDISNYLFGSPKEINPYTKYKNIRPITKMIMENRPKKEIIEFVSRNPNIYSGRYDFINDWIGQRVGYGKGFEYKTWDDLFTKRREKLAARSELREYFKLKNLELKYKNYVNQFKETKTLEEAKELMRQLEEKELMQSLDKTFYETTEKRRLKFFDEDMAKGEREYQKYLSGDYSSPAEKEILRYESRRSQPKKHMSNLEKTHVQQEFIMRMGIKGQNLNAQHKKALSFLTDRFEELLQHKGLYYKNLSDKQRNFFVDIIHNNLKYAGLDNTKWRKFYTSRDKLAIAQEVAKREKILREKHFAGKIIKGSIVQFAEGKKISKGVVESIDFAGDGTQFMRVLKNDGSIAINVKLDDIRVVQLNKKLVTLDDILAMSESTHKFYNRQLELIELIRENEAKIAKLDVSHKAGLELKAKELTKEFQIRAGKISGQLEDLEKQKISLQKNLHKGNWDEYEKTLGEMEKIQEALVNEDAFEQYVRTHLASDKVVDKVITDNVIKTGKVILDPDLKLNDKVRELAQLLRDELIKIGESEVAIGKLKPEQFKTMMLRYLPHILTDEGRKIFANVEEMIEHLPKVNTDFGFGYGGKSYNPFAKSRHVKSSLLQLEEWMQHKYGHILKGKNAFQTNLADIYLTRALKNTELIFDNDYMNNMLNWFGKDYTGVVEEGYGIAMNYGKFKETAVTTARLHLMCDISDSISGYLSIHFDNIYQETLKAVKTADYLEFKKTLNENFSKYIQRFLQKKYPDKVRKEVFEKWLKHFTTRTNTGGILEDLAVPMVELNDNNVQLINKFYRDAKTRFFDNIKNNIISYEKSKLYEYYENLLARSMYPFNVSEVVKEEIELITKHIYSKNFNINVASNYVEKLKKGADSVDLERIERILRKIDNYNNLPSLQIKQVNQAIIEKANQARKLQIAKDQNRFLQLYDKMLHSIKITQTSMMPAFHVRNKISNLFNSALGIGNDVFDVEFHKKTWEAIRNKGNVGGILKITHADGRIGSVTWEELFRKAMNYGVLDEGYFKAELGRGIDTPGVLRRVLNIPKHLDPTDTKNFAWYKKGQEIGSFIEGQDRLIHFASQVSRGMSFEDAAASVNKFLFDYSELTAFEQSVMKRIFPYYTWMRKNAPLQLEMMMEKPNMYQNVAKVFNAIESMVDEEDRVNKAYLPEFLDDWIQVPWRYDKRVTMFNPNVSFMDLNRLPSISPKKTFQNVLPQMSPFIKIPIEQIINRNVFLDAPIVKEGQNQITRRLDHVASHIAPYQAAKGFVQRRGSDLGYHALGTATGVKFLNYDYEAFKSKKIKELLEKKYDIKSKW